MIMITSGDSNRQGETTNDHMSPQILTLKPPSKAKSSHLFKYITFHIIIILMNEVLKWWLIIVLVGYRETKIDRCCLLD